MNGVVLRVGGGGGRGDRNTQPSHYSRINFVVRTIEITFLYVSLNKQQILIRRNNKINTTVQTLAEIKRGFTLSCDSHASLRVLTFYKKKEKKKKKRYKFGIFYEH